VLIRLAHSPDPDDAFMFWALAQGHTLRFIAAVQVEFVGS
jgi:predicted solute-binding protein